MDINHVSEIFTLHFPYTTRVCTCSYATYVQSNLKRHESSDTGEHNFNFSTCSYANNHERNLKRHLLIHCSERKCKWDLCPYATFWKNDLKKHETFSVLTSTHIHR